MIRPIENSDSTVETDPRFPSGEWKGFFIQQEFGLGRQQMSLELEFTNGTVRGSGSDVIGEFRMRGQYDNKTGEVNLLKQYLGQHCVSYDGRIYHHATHPRIMGVWTVGTSSMSLQGPFLIWPDASPDPTSRRAQNELYLPIEERGAVILDRAPQIQPLTNGYSFDPLMLLLEH